MAVVLKTLAELWLFMKPDNLNYSNFSFAVGFLEGTQSASSVTSACPQVLATGLSALYSSLPRKIEVIVVFHLLLLLLHLLFACCLLDFFYLKM